MLKFRRSLGILLCEFIVCILTSLEAENLIELVELEFESLTPNLPLEIEFDYSSYRFSSSISSKILLKLSVPVFSRTA